MWRHFCPFPLFFWRRHWARAPMRRPWGRINTLFAVIDAFLSRNFIPTYALNVYFLEKTHKNRWELRHWTPASLRRLGVPPPDLRVVTSACYFSFVGVVSSTKYVLLYYCIEKVQNTYSKWLKSQYFAVNVLILLLPHFCTYFSLQTLHCSFY